MKSVSNETNVNVRLVCIGLLVAFAAGTARAELRSVLMTVKHDEGWTAKVSIRSDVKDEQKEDISIDQACAVIRQMRGWGSAVNVFVISDRNLRAADLKNLVSGIADNIHTELVYLRNGLSREWVEVFLRKSEVEPTDTKSPNSSIPAGSKLPREEELALENLLRESELIVVGTLRRTDDSTADKMWAGHIDVARVLLGNPSLKDVHVHFQPPTVRRGAARRETGQAGIWFVYGEGGSRQVVWPNQLRPIAFEKTLHPYLKRFLEEEINRLSKAGGDKNAARLEHLKANYQAVQVADPPSPPRAAADGQLTMQLSYAVSKPVTVPPATAKLFREVVARPPARSLPESPFVAEWTAMFEGDGNAYEWFGNVIGQRAGDEWRYWGCPRLAVLFHRMAVAALIVTVELSVNAPAGAEQVTSWLKELDSPDAHTRLEAIRKIGNWAHPDLSAALLSDDLDTRRQARRRIEVVGLPVITKALVDRLARNVENGEGYQEGSVSVTSPGGIRRHVRVECENEALAKALKQLGATEAVELLKGIHGENMKLPAEERSSSVTHTFAYCIYMLSMEQVDVWEAGKARPFGPSPILEEEARRLLRPDLKPTRGLTASLRVSSASRYPQFFVGNAKLVVVLTLTNCTDEAIPLDLSPESITFSLVDSGGHRTNIPAGQLAQPVRDATLRSVGPRKSATCTWHIERLSDSPLGRPMKPGYVALKAVYSPVDETVRKRWHGPTLVSNTLNQPYFEHTQPDKPWQLLQKGKLATVEVERTLYEKPGHPHFFVHIRVTNDTDRILGVDLRDYWKVVYPNQWGPSSVDHRLAINEGRVPYPPLEQAARDKLLADFRGGKLTTIPAGKAVDYYRAFNASGRADVEKALKDQKYLIVSLNGQQLLTDGRQVEQISCDWEQIETGNTDLVIAAPAPWKKAPMADGSSLNPDKPRNDFDSRFELCKRSTTAMRRHATADAGRGRVLTSPDHRFWREVTCRSCHHRVRASRSPRGSRLLAFGLLLLGVLPGILYMFLRQGFIYRCPECGASWHSDQ